MWFSLINTSQVGSEENVGNGEEESEDGHFSLTPSRAAVYEQETGDRGNEGRGKVKESSV